MNKWINKEQNGNIKMAKTTKLYRNYLAKINKT